MSDESTKYSRDFKLRAIATLEHFEGNILRTSREIDVSRKTLMRWRDEATQDFSKREIAQVAKELFDEDAHLLRDVSAKALRRVAALLETETNLKNITEFIRMASEMGLQEIITSDLIKRTFAKDSIKTKDAPTIASSPDFFGRGTSSN